ncbi:glycosyltransferase family 2 protein [Pseudomonas sp. MWU12-2345]|uniref:glycosyltransferase family 2 protein n=1 Tax=Pseudomonas sp. MWU12-2345 TaxID=2928689 RepID=UPI0020105B5F|nr:glycosyltransferase family 2 protein [Pseudomonas sp. MWU12-2345]
MSNIKASVIIPTKNPGEIFRPVLDSVLSQLTDWPFEVVVIDSGSRDGTVEFVRSKANVKLIEIPAHEFGHGRSRNTAIANSVGEYAAVITHDAQPVDPHWLQHLVEIAESDTRIAGVFGKHIAYPQASVFTRRELELHFAGFKEAPIVHLDDANRYAEDVGYRQFLHFFSDNNALLRRSVWETIPYPDVDFAEDQSWAKSIIEAGYYKAYSDAGAVYHSHDYSLFERLQRSFDESYAFKRIFGYILCPDLISMFKSVVALSRRDVRYARSIGMLRRAPLQVVHAVMDNVMRLLGHYLGSRGEKIPTPLRKQISRDKKLLAQ